MSVLYVMVPAAILLAAVAVLAFVWAARGGQLDDLDTPPLRVLFDDDDPGGTAGAGTPPAGGGGRAGCVPPAATPRGRRPRGGRD